MIQDHYLTEDLEQVTVHLDIIHKSLMQILGGATKADFELAEQSQVQLFKSLDVMAALNKRKLKRDEVDGLNYASEFIRRNYF